jgi:HK97 family phage major capsid protein
LKKGEKTFYSGGKKNMAKDMLKVMEYRQQKKALVEEGKGIVEKYEGEKRAVTKDEQTRIDAIDAEISAVETREANFIKMNRISEEELRTYEPQKQNPGDGGAATPKPFGTGLRGMGEQLLAVANHYMGRGTDPRLMEVRAATGLNETIPSEGGFQVQQDFAAELIKETYDNSEILRRCRKIPISGPSNSFSQNMIDETSRATGSRMGGLQVYWEAEAASMSGLSSKPKFAKIDLKLQKLMGLCYATDENLADAAQLGGIIKEAFPEEFDFVVSDAVIRGDGAGKPLGILGDSDFYVEVAKETGQAADTVNAKNILNMWKSRRGRNLVWLYNQELEDQLNTLNIAIGTGGALVPLFQEPKGTSPYGTIKGAPALPVEVASGPGDVGDIILADLNQYLLIDKGGIQMAESIHVEFLTAQTVFRFTYRVNGQPIGKKLTPYKRTSASFYTAPFVVLAAR